MENLREKQNEARFAAGSTATAATRSAIVRSYIAATGSSIVVVGWGWEAKSRWWRREGEREGESKREAESADG